MARGKTRSMDAKKCWIIEKRSFRQKPYGHAMTIEAKSFGMAIHAQLFLRCRSYSMLPDEIAGMNQVIVRTHAFVS